MTDTITQLCECSEEMCYCTNSTEIPVELFERGASVRWQCTPCVQGRHVWTPGGGRDPWPVRESVYPPPDPHGCTLAVVVGLGLLVVFVVVGVIAIVLVANWLWP